VTFGDLSWKCTAEKSQIPSLQKDDLSRYDQLSQAPQKCTGIVLFAQFLSIVSAASTLSFFLLRAPLDSVLKCFMPGSASEKHRLRQV
jgi:hypothetical protein